VLHDVRDEDALAVDACLVESPVEQLTGRAHERLAGEILAIARLLADEHDAGRDPALTEDGLGGPLPEIARPAARRGVAHVVEAGPAGGGRRDGGRGTRLRGDGSEIVDGRPRHQRRAAAAGGRSLVVERPFRITVRFVSARLRRAGVRPGAVLHPAGNADGGASRSTAMPSQACPIAR
jgi:hypothetical protein